MSSAIGDAKNVDLNKLSIDAPKNAGATLDRR